MTNLSLPLLAAHEQPKTRFHRADVEGQKDDSIDNKVTIIKTLSQLKEVSDFDLDGFEVNKNSELTNFNILI